MDDDNDEDDGGPDNAQPLPPDPDVNEVAALAAAEGFFDMYGRGHRADAVIRAIFKLRRQFRKGLDRDH